MEKGLPENVKLFINTQNWIFAKTYADTWPHEYIVQEKVDNKLFNEFAKFIDKNGYIEYFYKMKQVYYQYNGKTYWHMENIINRCDISETYHERKKNGRLPEERKE